VAKRQPPRPKSTAGLPPSLAAYWAKKGVPSGGSSKSTSKKSSSKKSTSKKSGRKRSSRKK
jgi:hypothetical protein